MKSYLEHTVEDTDVFTLYVDDTWPRIGLQLRVMVSGFPVDVERVEYRRAVDNPGLMDDAAYHTSAPTETAELSNLGKAATFWILCEVPTL